MAEIYRVKGDGEHFPTFCFPDSGTEVLSLIEEIESGLLSEKWAGVSFSSRPADTPGEGYTSDCPFLLSNILVLSGRAYKGLIEGPEYMDCRCVEIHVEGEPFFLILPKTVLDILDEERSWIDRVGGRLIYPNRIAVRKTEGVSYPYLFRVKGLEPFAVFCNEEFFSNVEREQLKGFDFEPVNQQ